MASVRIAAALLAAGRASRFGSNKLEAILDGTMLGTHAARALKSIESDWLMAVCNPAHTNITSALRDIGFDILENDAPEAGLSHSLALAARAAERVGADALLIALADMPFVTSAHIRGLIEASGDHQGRRCAASACAARPMPPAIFPRAMFGALVKMTGDAGARSLLREAVVVTTDSASLADIDTVEDFRRLGAR
jgi:molybdenum cofactor cytidylyltransferase